MPLGSYGHMIRRGFHVLFTQIGAALTPRVGLLQQGVEGVLADLEDRESSICLLRVIQ